MIGNAKLTGAVAALVMGIAFGAGAQEGTQSSVGDVVATVNGIAITYADIALAEEELIGVIEQLPEQKRFETLMNYMVERVLASEAARKEGLASDADVATRRAFFERKALQDVYIARQLAKEVTERDVAAYYRKEIKNAPVQEEVWARHILLDSRAEAQEVVRALKGGADFAELAKQRSKGPSGASGGDLGYFGREAMVEPFAEAAFKLKKGRISPPVETQFGWHVIKLEDRRAKPVPTLDETRARIYQILMGQARRDLYQNMRRKAKVEFVDIPLTPE